MSAVALALLWSPAPVVAGWCSPDWRVRDAATALSARYGPADAAWRWAGALGCLECRVRAERGQALALSAALRRLGPIPNADACWFDPRRRRYDEAACVNPFAALGLKAALAEVAHLPGGYPHDKYQRATRRFVAAELRAGCRESRLATLLAEMRRRDRAYYASYNWPVPWGK